MAFRRSVALDYGVPADGTVTLGGENRTMVLKAWDMTETYDTIAIEASFTACGVGLTPAARSQSFAEQMQSLQYLYTHSGDLTIGQDTLREFTCSFATAGGNGTITDTSGGSFTSADEGRLISVDSIGTWRILSVAGTAATIVLVPGVTAPADNAATTARVLNSVVTTAQSTRLRGYNARVNIFQTAEPLDTKWRQTFAVSITMEKAAIDSRDLGRRAARISVSTATDGRQMISMAGVYTGSGVSNAVQQYAAQFETWKNSVLSDFTGNFEAMPQSQDYDDEKALVFFVAGFRELLLEESVGASDQDDTQLSEQSLTMTRRSVNNHGVPGAIPPPMIEVTYATRILKTVDSDTWRTAIYEAKVLPHIMNQIKLKFGSGVAVLLEDLPTFDPATGSMSTFLQVQLNLGITSTLLAYSRTVMMGLTAQKTVANRWTKKKHDYTTFSPTIMINGSVVTKEVRRGPAVFNGQEIFEGVQSFPGSIDYDSDTQWSQPPSPDAIFPASVVGPTDTQGWIFLDAKFANDYSYKGRSINGAIGVDTVAQDLVTVSAYKTSWLWGTEIRDELSAKNAGLGGRVAEDGFGSPADRDVFDFPDDVDEDGRPITGASIGQKINTTSNLTFKVE